MPFYIDIDCVSFWALAAVWMRCPFFWDIWTL